jgi:hypothetical protein
VLESLADVAMADVWEARHLVAKAHVCRRGRRANEAAERIAAGAEVAGLMVWMDDITSERPGVDGRLQVASANFRRPRSGWLRMRKTAKRLGRWGFGASWSDGLAGGVKASEAGKAFCTRRAPSSSMPWSVNGLFPSVVRLIPHRRHREYVN